MISSSQRWLITLAVMSATLMQVLDSTIVNVALPHMQGALGVTPDEVTWILTSYLVASAIVMPLTGYFTDTLGRRNYLLICITGFVISSALCGVAQNMTQMVLFRILQGIFGASLVPLSQAIMTDIFPLEQRGAAMAIWGIGVMVGPILGPTLGGYITEMSSWRWNFYINLPVGAISLLLAWYLVPDTEKRARRMDWIGLILISTGIAATQFFLDRGTQEDWFKSRTICLAAFLGGSCLVGFCLYSLNGRMNAVFDLRIFKDRNFAVCSLILAVFGIGLFGTMVVLPLMLENLFNYPVLMTGLLMAPRGMSGMLSMMIAGKIINRFDPRLLITLGIILSIAGNWVGTHYNLMMSSFWIVWPLLVQGLGLGLVFVPISTVAFSTLSPSMRAEAAGIFSLLRTIGASLGISIIMTIYSRHLQMAWNQIGGFIQPYNPQLIVYLNSLHVKMNDPLAITALSTELSQQAQMMSFINVFAFISFSFVLMFPLVFLIKRTKIDKPTEVMEA